MRAELESIFEHVSEDVTAHCGDTTENEPRRPAFVVEATRPEQVGALLALASDRGVPVTPKVTGQNVGGLAIPAEGGIVLDLRRLDAVEIDPANLVAWIEPGVGWQKLKEEAARHGLTLGFPLAPPESSVLACALMDGLGTRSLAYGSYADWVHGVVAYLADGTRVVTGSAALSGRPVSRGPLPDLTGMFLGWFGATGVVVRLAIALWPERLHRRREAIACLSVEEGVSFLRQGRPSASSTISEGSAGLPASGRSGSSGSARGIPPSRSCTSSRTTRPTRRRSYAGSGSASSISRRGSRSPSRTCSGSPRTSRRSRSCPRASGSSSTTRAAA